jgi:hypothetical protein
MPNKIAWNQPAGPMIDRYFLSHPREVGETYFAHQRVALSFSVRLFAAACACLIHALVPGVFKTTGSRAVSALHQRMVVNRRGNPVPERSASSMDSKQPVL